MQLTSLNIGTVRALPIEGRRIMTAIGKTSATGPLAVGPLGLAGDEQADPSVHGGLAKAVYAYPQEHLPWWQQRRREHGVDLFDTPLPAGAMGENLTLCGLTEADVWVGDELHFPDCVLRVTQPREPCYKFAAVMGYAQAVRDMFQSGRSGWYLAVQRPGTIEAGQSFTLRPGPRQVDLAQALAARARRRAG